MAYANNLSVSTDVVGLKDRATVTFTVKAPQSGKLLQVTPYVFVNHSGLNVIQSLGAQSVSLSNGASKELSVDIALTDQRCAQLQEWHVQNPSVRAVPFSVIVYMSYQAETWDGSMAYESASEEFTDAALLLIAPYALTIRGFSVNRAIDGVVNDEGEAVLTDLQLGAAEGVDVTVDGGLPLSLKLYYAQGAEATEASECIDLTDRIAAGMAGIAGSGELIPLPFDNGSDWAFLLVFSDGYAPATAYSAVAKAFANVHLSGATTGGVAFGKFSASEEGAPLFECAYPAQMLGGIEGVNRYSTEEVLTGGVWIDGKPLYRKLLVYTSSIAGTYEDTDISDLNFEYIRIVSDVFCYKYGSNAYIYWAQGCWRNNDDDNHRMYIRDNTMRIADGAKVKRQAEYILLEYTKAESEQAAAGEA